METCVAPLEYAAVINALNAGPTWSADVENDDPNTPISTEMPSASMASTAFVTRMGGSPSSKGSMVNSTVTTSESLRGNFVSPTGAEMEERELGYLAEPGECQSSPINQPVEPMQTQ